MWQYLKEIFILDSSSLDFFNKEYHWFSRNRDNFSYCYLTLQEIIDNNEWTVTTDISNLLIVLDFLFF